MPDTFDSSCPAIAADKVLAAELVGVWSLETFTNTEAAKEPIHPLGENPEGMLIYTSDGFVSVQMMRHARPKIASDTWGVATLIEQEDLASGYIGYCGRYLVDESKATVRHIPDIALVPNLIGERLTRSIALHSHHLILTVVNASTEGVPVETCLRWRRRS